jgi:glycosyltransferase involved in cell wall biosynthesis
LILLYPAIKFNHNRSVAQSGSALEWGSRGRWFKSSRSDMYGDFQIPFFISENMVTYQVLIPAYNAEKTLPVLLRQIQQLAHQPAGVLVIDDGSADGTAAAARSANAQVYRLDTNGGKGRALCRGFEILVNDHAAENIICMDADLQHPAASIPDFLDKVSTCNSRFVIGVRRRSGSGMPLSRRLSNSITSLVLSLLAGQKIKDSQCGFRLIGKDVLAGLSLRQKGFQLESEMLLEVAARKIKIAEVAIPTLYAAEHSHIHHVADTFKFIHFILLTLGQRMICALRNKKRK